MTAIVREPHAGQLLATIACPSCHKEHPTHIHITAESSRRVAKRPATPEIVHVCPHCAAVLVVSLHPASQKAIAS